MSVFPHASETGGPEGLEGPHGPGRRVTGCRAARRVGAVALGTVALVLAPAVAADAHVRVHPDSTAAGSYSQLSFRVPTESAAASTTAVTVTLPQDRPFTSVSVRPMSGWTSRLVTDPLPHPVMVKGATITKAVHTVTWTADPASALAPGQYQQFDIWVDPLPDSGDVVMPTAQSYSDGTVVRWDEVAKAGSAEPEHPAPAFTVTPTGARQTSVQSAASGGDTAGPTAATGNGSDTLARWLGGAGLAVGVVALMGAVPIARKFGRRA